MNMKKLPAYKQSDIELSTLDHWQKAEIFQKTLDATKDAKPFSFYDGPPFANGLPHFGHSLVTAIKDAMGRYKTMQGFYVERRNGWDTHGLPVEFEIEKKFGVSGKKQILELGLDKFNQACRESVFAYKQQWEDFFRRIGRWTEFERSYATIDTDFIESVWWAISQVHQKDLLYRGYKSMPYCPRCETPLSNFELNEGYREDVEDPSLYVKFKLRDDPDGASMLAWTTTPWSLPGNAALAIKPDEKYVRVEVSNEDGTTEQLILAQKRLEVLEAGNYKLMGEVAADTLIGQRYEPLFDIKFDDPKDAAFQIWGAGDIVSIDDGTGVLHVAPAFGEDDLELAQAHGIPVFNTVDPSGHLTEVVTVANLAGKFFKAADSHIIEYLTERGAVYNAETLRHIYPFCYRCDSPLLYYAVTTWFIRVSSLRDEMGQTAKDITWVPAHVKDGRFGKWLEGARDWAISRNRYWGAPLPIWINEQDPDDYIVVGSIVELQKLAHPDKPDLTDLHRPGIDAVVIHRDGKTYRRAEEVIDCWFESGSMPYAQNHYPFENAEHFEQAFPADYVGEGLDQTRLWFYVLHVLSTILFDKPAYRNVIVNGMILAADGQKLSKRLKNYPPIDDVFAQEGADSLRYYLLSSPATVGEYMRFSRDGLRDVSRNLFGTLYNTASFLALYAEIDTWQADSMARPTDLENPLDRWMLARLDETIAAVTLGADGYDLGRATRPIAELVDDLSNWYVRRSRRRFWKSDNDADKQQAYETLYYTLVTICQLLAPWCPFISDFLYRHLSAGVPGAAESVHLTRWPVGAKLDARILEGMQAVREVVTQGLAQRADAGIKVRQPLAKIQLGQDWAIGDDYNAILKEELNVKAIEIGFTPESKRLIKLDTTLTDELRAEGLVREVIRHIQTTRKQIGLAVEDRIELELATTDQALRNAIETHQKLVAAEVLADKIDFVESTEATPVKIDQYQLGISIRKV